ncbi:MAG: hypothetical protein ACYCYE_10630 [Clostridia bacterium]
MIELQEEHGMNLPTGIWLIEYCIVAPDIAALPPPSQGAKLRQGEGLRGPVQWCRECGDVK